MAQGQLEMSFMTDILKVMPYMMLIMFVAVYGWYWSIVTGLKKYLPKGVSTPVLAFQIVMVLSTVGMIFYTYTIMDVMGSIFTNMPAMDLSNPEEPPVVNPEDIMGQHVISKMFMVFPVALLCMLGMLFCLYVVARTYKAVELQRKVGFSDFVGEFFLDWSSFVGVWIMQPRINEFAKGNIPTPEEEQEASGTYDN